MAERNQKVYDRVRAELGKNSNLGSRDLYEIAKKMDDGIGKDTLQQFHARYVLPLKRGRGATKRTAAAGAAPRGRRARKTRETPAAAAKTAAPRRPRGRRTISSEMGERDRIRAVLLKFAQDFSAADTKSEIVGVMSKLDDYVNQIAANGK